MNLQVELVKARLAGMSYLRTYKTRDTESDAPALWYDVYQIHIHRHGTMTFEELKKEMDRYNVDSKYHRIINCKLGGHFY